MIIRPATPTDAEAIAAVHVATWQAAYRGLMPDAVLDALDVPARATFWRRLLSGHHHTFVAESDGELVGFCSLILPREAGPGTRPPAEIAALYVSPAHWRQGAGRALCAAAFRAADSCPAVTLWVLASNSPAIAFYEAQGFSRDGAIRTETDSLGGSRHEISMRRALK